jgi:hypothetical protein
MALGMTKITGTAIEASESVAASSLEWASDTGGTPINAGAGEWFTVVNIQVSVAFNASATAGAEVHLRKSVDDATTENTALTYAATVPLTAGATVIITIPVYDFDYLDVGLNNLDATYTATWSAKYDGWKITGMA